MKRKLLYLVLTTFVSGAVLTGCYQMPFDAESYEALLQALSGQATVQEEVSPEAQTPALSEEPTDYSEESHWMHLPEITKEVDTFYIYPTMLYSDYQNKPDYCAVDDEEMCAGAIDCYVKQGSVFEESTNVFAPFYRQTNINVAEREQIDAAEYEEYCNRIPKTDIYAALDYYFENYNNGRPFIIAGHSQGSCMTKIALGEYFSKLHPEYLKRLIVAYPIGFSVTKDWLNEHPEYTFAEGAEDTGGVIVSWNTESPANGQSCPTSIVKAEGAVAINPINWKRDDTYAEASENLGSHIENPETGEYETLMNYADAQVDTERGTVLVTTNDNFTPTDLFGPESFHSLDYDLFYYNLKENVKTRVDAWLAEQSE